MNKDQVKGRIKEATGKAQKNLGKMTDNKSQQMKGLAKEAEGKVQKNLGDAKNKVSKAIDN